MLLRVRSLSHLGGRRLFADVIRLLSSSRRLRSRFAPLPPPLLRVPSLHLPYLHADVVLEPAPGIWSPTQVAQWKEVTKRVHARGGTIFLQQWALGRANQNGQPGVKAVGMSAIPIEGAEVTPEELTEEDILRSFRLSISIPAAFSLLTKRGDLQATSSTTSSPP